MLRVRLTQPWRPVFSWGGLNLQDMQRTLKKVPLFPLNIVGSPGATRQLRIFEPRYRQMFQDLFSEVRRGERERGLGALLGHLQHREVVSTPRG